ncbi:aldose epimerase family protein [Actomonas aquatica]|uniref:Aldose 1-epimerase n=1 Tax=Actomonas aquatica TaxID=2866162 RepID=A0ABZ1C685_9BACT|nr:aldose epimerase family protein [Opitutus sp. WL0086]WRQ87160.1 aldose epimerase family protein [Opitutus sp. WL0086]
MASTSHELNGAGNWASVARKPFGETKSGEATELFTLTNAKGMRVEITNYGGIIVRWTAPDREGKLADVVLGYDDLAAYEAGGAYFGAVVGRFGNRIAGGQFTLDDETYTLPTNNAPGGIPCHLHGGPEGFDRKVWAAEVAAEGESARLTLKLESPAGEAGFPGTLAVTVVYLLKPENTLEITYTATTDAATPVNLTQHTYFNLAGEGTIDGHILQMQGASRYLPVDAGQIPTGELAPVAGTPFDFLAPRPLGARIAEDHPQIKIGCGYDHCWVFDDADGTTHLAAKVMEPISGRVLEVLTTEPGMQVYTGAFIKPGDQGKDGAIYDARSGFCLETQHFPDSPNQPTFPSTILRPGETYRSVTAFRFGTI